MDPQWARELADYMEEGRRRIEEDLDRRVPPLGSAPSVLHEGMRYTLLAGGKRVRGVLVLATCELLRGSREAAMPLAAAVEMVHASSLILDDLPSMDDATLRRGRSALHLELGEANAILAAVALLNAAYGEIQKASELRERVRGEAAGRLTWAIGSGGLIGGQIVDLESTGRELDLEALEFIHSHKTGALFIAAAELGALAAGGRKRDIAALQRYAKNLGLAFQITDDLLDYSGDPASTGKDAGRDRDKTTFADLCGIDGSRRLVDELIDASIAALEPFGRRARLLTALAEFVRSRDR
jgi:geranylgeranyl diphosphate synthase type II